MNKRFKLMCKGRMLDVYATDEIDGDIEGLEEQYKMDVYDIIKRIADTGGYGNREKFWKPRNTGCKHMWEIKIWKKRYFGIFNRHFFIYCTSQKKEKKLPQKDYQFFCKKGKCLGLE